MIENIEKNQIGPVEIQKVIDEVTLPWIFNKSPRTEANVLIEDAIVRRSIARANDALLKKNSEEKTKQNIGRLLG